ncbi:MAG: lipid kinase [Scytolyngbya sp. HA4215-MV1]|jgi:YegS/Rv2252/BmrU family lipid kinase|nr:lipid kinase [Scytolyngbya sp. HA4215-MV1]
MNKRALLLVNRHARRGQAALTAAIAQLQDLGLHLIEQSTEHPDQLPETIQHYRQQVDLVIVGGGDGTLNAAVQGLVNTDLPLGILPLGTANDLARTLGIPTNLPEACRIIATGQPRAIDLGWVNGRYFFNAASLGLSVQITEQLSHEIKRRWGVFAYAIAALQVLWRSRPFAAEIRIRQEVAKVSTVQIVVGNGRYYGGGMTVAEDAVIDDQRLDLYSLEIDHWWQMLPLLPALRWGKQATLPNFHIRHGQEIEVSTYRSHPINTDGEITTQTPARFRVIPRSLQVMVPGQSATAGLSDRA